MKRQLIKIAKSFFSGEPKALPSGSRGTSSHDSEDDPQQTVIVVDCSTSMARKDFSPSRLKAAKSSAIDFARERAKRNPQDEIAVVSFETFAHLECPMRSVSHMHEIERATKNISLGGFTAMGRGLREAEKVLLGRDLQGMLSRAWNWLNDEQTSRQQADSVHRVVLLTDGHQSPDHGCEPLPVAERLKQTGVQIDCIGIGGDPSIVDEVLLKNIASINEATGKPRYRFIKDQAALQAHFRKLATSITR